MRCAAIGTCPYHGENPAEWSAGRNGATTFPKSTDTPTSAVAIAAMIAAKAMIVILRIMFFPFLFSVDVRPKRQAAQPTIRTNSAYGTRLARRAQQMSIHLPLLLEPAQSRFVVKQSIDKKCAEIRNGQDAPLVSNIAAVQLNAPSYVGIPVAADELPH